MAWNKQDQKNKNEIKSGNQPMDKKSKIAIAVFAAVVVLIVGAAIVISSLQRGGAFLRSTVGFETEHFRIDNAMVSYYMYDEMYTRVEENPDIYAEYGFDIEKPLREQMFDENNTWFNYFSDRASEKIGDILVFLEAAYKNDIGLNGDEFDRLDKEMAALGREADAAGMGLDDYIAYRYGKGVTADDVRRAKEYYAIAEKAHDDMYQAETYEESDVRKFYQDYRQLFLKADCIFFTVDADTSSMNDKDAIAEAQATAKADAEALIKCSTADEFLDNLRAYMNENMDSVTAEEKMNNVVHNDYSYVSNNKLSSWLFSGIRVAGDKTVIKFNDDRYTAIYVVKAAENISGVSKNVRDIFIDYLNYETQAAAEEAANQALESFMSGEQTENAFAVLASELSEDQATALKDGLIANIDADSNEVYAAWAHEKGRKAGDTTILKDKNGIHVLYFVGDGRETWLNLSEEYMRARDYQQKYEELLESITITRDKNKYTQIKERDM